MSLRTSADESLDHAKENIAMAIQNISRIVIQKEWGCDDFCEEYKNRINESFIELLKIRNKLDTKLEPDN